MLIMKNKHWEDKGMFGTLPTWDDVTLYRDDYGKLVDAISERNYPALYACLRKTEKTFEVREASQLCSLAIRYGCTLHAFEAILEHCVPLDEVVRYSDGICRIMTGEFWANGGLVQEAAAYCQSHIMEYLLDRGFSPNTRSTSECSALEAALYNNAIGAVTLLEQREEVDFAVTDRILDIWSTMGMSPVRDICLRIIAGRLLGEGKGVFRQEIPLLPGLTVLHAAEQENWPLVMRLCRETAVTEQQGKQVLDAYMHCSGLLDVPVLAPLLDALFTACPQLLRCEYPRYLLALSILSGEEQDIAVLRPWLEKMPGQMVVLAGRRLTEREYDVVACMGRWKERIGSRAQPVLRRDKLLPVRSMARTDDSVIRELIGNSVIRGRTRKGEVSRLAMDVLYMASPELVAELCEAEKLFPQEDMEALVEFCENMSAKNRLSKRNVLLIYNKKTVDYEL